VPFFRSTPRLALGLLLAACGIRNGGGWDGELPAPPSSPAVSLVLIGDAGAPGRHAAAVAARLDHVLEREKIEGFHPIVLWLGNNVYPRGLGPDGKRDGCTAPDDAWKRRGVSRLARAVRDHIARDGDSYAVLGAIDWTCLRPQLQIQENYADGPHPWIMPAFHYVVRVHADGHSDVVSSCSEDHSCRSTLPDPDRPPLFDLVFVDTGAWTTPPDRSSRHALARNSLREMETLIESLQGQAETATQPRILVTSMPVESAGYHGHGGIDPKAMFSALHPVLQSALRQGLFVGVVSGHDRNLQVAPDISNAIKRSAKVWIEAPTFQIVSGAASHPDGRSARALRWRQGTTLRPALASTQAGFAVLRISSGRVDAILHRQGTRWHSGVVSFPLRREGHPVEGPLPSMAPCRDCRDVPPGEQRYESAGSGNGNGDGNGAG
jgi:hypothetical protein